MVCVRSWIFGGWPTGGRSSDPCDIYRAGVSSGEGIETTCLSYYFWDVWRYSSFVVCLGLDGFS